MSIEIHKYAFNGPHADLKKIEDRSGVYAILAKKSDNEYAIIDIGESSMLYSRLLNHDRKECWQECCGNAIYYAVHYTHNAQKPGRMEIEQELRNLYDLPCGKR